MAQETPKSPKSVVLAGELLPSSGNVKQLPNFIATQITGKLPFAIDVVFESGSFIGRHDLLAGEVYTEALKWHQSRFNQRFEKTFQLQEKGYSFKH